MTKEERDALIASARKTPWLDTMKRRETEALLEALDDAEKRVRDIEDLRARIVSAMSCEPDDDSDLVEAVRENVRERDDAERERDAARAQLAALREAAARYVHSLGEDEETHPTLGRVFVSRDDDGAEDALDEALADTAPAVEAYTRRVQAEALESAADSVCDHEQLAEGRTLAAERTSLQRWLRARAAEIRGGR